MGAVLLSLVLLLTPSAGATDLSTQARELAELRARVEELSSQLTLDKEDLSARLRAMDAQRADLEVQVRREELRMQQLQEAADKQREALAVDAAAGDVLRPALDQSFDAIDAAIAGGLPYRVSERRQALSDLRAQLDDDLLTPQQASARLWAFVEDERRLARENALDRQVITLGDQELLVEVARLGMVAILFRGEDGRLGWAERSGGEWRWATTTDTAEKEQLMTVFDALTKQIRVGWFELPGPAFAAAAGGAG